MQNTENYKKAVKTCEKWIKTYGEITESIRTAWGTSYGHKHQVESWTRRTMYIPEQAFIEAAKNLGIGMQPTRRGSMSMRFALSLSKWKKAIRNGKETED